ncbi:hypothetical protein [Vibrio sp. THAF190c]|uniref:hypothetical protein n=1 Tax=Vibrio sp. THAF190c TaxID=2587865 RepID=UPI00126976B5|nr:hypothetical protein [Vibrio sp. THAF190c]QFT13079.1 hypothetical protein FIV04_24350 [Vibrio sp. THAF190c]
MINIELSDYWELLALHNVLMEAKFHENPFKPEIQLSPHVKSLTDKVFEALINTESPAPGFDKAGWLTWRKATEDRREVKLLLNKISSDPSWVHLNHSERAEYIQTFMSPLKIDEDLKTKIIV